VCHSAGMALPWSVAWRRASTGPDGFWRREVPSAHFATSTGAVLALGMVRLLQDVDARLGSGDLIDVIDIGAGDGSLLNGMAALLEGTDLGARCRWAGIDVRPRPPGLRTDVAWCEGDALSLAPGSVRGLVMAHEWLDEVPLDVVERDRREVDRLVLVEDDGSEILGDPLTPDGAHAAWAAEWWPLARPGDRAEIGTTRDRAWRVLCAALTSGTVLATDYAHRRGGGGYVGPRRPTLRGYRSGTLVNAVPDGSCNITAHVAIDSCAAATQTSTPANGSITTSIRSQREALADLGQDGDLPDPTAQSAEGYARDLALALEARALRSPAGRGSFAWLRTDVS